MLTTKTRFRYKKLLIGGGIVLLGIAAVVWYIFNEKFADMATEKADYTVHAMDFIKEFQHNTRLANEKYTEKIITVKGMVNQVEAADTTANIKFIDTLTGAYIICAFQQQHLAEAKQIKQGDEVTIKGSCSGAVYSEILATQYISFKRCAIDE